MLKLEETPLHSEFSITCLKQSVEGEIHLAGDPSLLNEYEYNISRLILTRCTSLPIDRVIRPHKLTVK